MHYFILFKIKKHYTFINYDPLTINLKLINYSNLIFLTYTPELIQKFKMFLKDKCELIYRG